MFHIEKPDDSSVEQMFELAKKCRLSAWTKEHYRDELYRADSQQMIVSADSKIIGFVITRLINNFQTENNSCIFFEEAEILSIGVDPEFQNQGIGQILLDKILESACLCGVKKVWLEVRESNKPAFQFYKKNHFVFMQTRKNYFQDPPENASVMKRDLDLKKLDLKT